ncbi:RNA polymerase-binding protein DksA [Thermosulfurimonas sp. F29]|uniref:RNA polymerase-binding protein DksA n=1 Tax=Thermosulfurimonas sp. F29 TaxID=2867247 RepID=UPI001C82DAE9|nr:RNA polymerase-binding protein DksA [Thermosulfurimonas sp. F29]MBX6423963.1 RNA polymerase-binding protein DksA [Thermosulfurimonas sp. F29]
MDPRKLEHFKNLLIEKKKKLLAEADRTFHALEGGAEHLADPTDIATMESDLGFELRLRDRERKLIKKIDRALQKIEEGSYGICEACGEEIEEKRLEARPEATLCIRCKREQERMERLRGE